MCKFSEGGWLSVCVGDFVRLYCDIETKNIKRTKGIVQRKPCSLHEAKKVR